MSDRQGTREILEEFITIYRNETCLWLIKSKDYHNRDRKTAAYNKLMKVYQKLEPNANRDVIVKKLNALRTNYRKEKKKVEESTRSGAGTNDVYVPTLWYYNLLKFLDDDQGMPRSSRSNIEENDSLQLSHETESVFDSQDGGDNSSETGSTYEQTSNYRRPPKRKTSDSTDLSDEVLRSVNEHFKRPVLKDDRFDIFGKNVAMKLRDISKEQRIIAEKIINDTLFQGEMGTLTLPQKEFQQYESIRATPTPSPPPYQTEQFIRATPTPSPPSHHTQQFIRATPTPSPPSHHTQQFIRATPTPSPPSHHTQQFIRATPSPSLSSHHTQQFIRATPTPSPPSHQTQQFIRATPTSQPQQFIVSTLSPSTPLPDIQQEYDYTSSNSGSQYSLDTIGQSSNPEQSAGTYVSTSSPSSPLPDIQQEYDYTSSHSGSQYSSETIVQLSIPEQSAGTYVSNFKDV